MSEERKILDSGERRQFASGAVRDIQEGKGRCDLLPLDTLSDYYKHYASKQGNECYKYCVLAEILNEIYKFIMTGDEASIFKVIDDFSVVMYTENTEPKQYYSAQSFMILEVSKHYEEGARKYAERNWEKGIDCHAYVDSGVRHLIKFFDDWKDEPHDRAFIWNMLGLLWTIKHHPECNDLPYAKEVKE